MVSDEIIQQWADAVPVLQTFEQVEQNFNSNMESLRKYKKLRGEALTPDAKSDRKTTIIVIVGLLSVISFATLPLVPVVEKMENQLFAQLITLAALIAFIAITAPIVHSFTKKSAVKRGKKRAAELDIEIEKTQKFVDKFRAEYSSIMNEHGYKISFIPKSYRNSYAAECIYWIFNNGRADSLKEALNVFENDEHGRRLEQNQQSIMDKQRELEYRVEDAESRASAAETAAYWAIERSNNNY